MVNNKLAAKKVFCFFLQSLFVGSVCFLSLGCAGAEVCAESVSSETGSVLS